VIAVRCLAITRRMGNAITKPALSSARLEALEPRQLLTLATKDFGLDPTNLLLSYRLAHVGARTIGGNDKDNQIVIKYHPLGTH